MPQLRPIAPVDIKDDVPRMPTTGMPTWRIVDPTTLVVDDSYQRKLGEKGMAQIRRIVREFCWTKFKPPICAQAEYKGRLALIVLDGQHTAIAAATNPHVSEIPVMLIEAPDTSVQARAFVGQNTGKLNVTPLQIHTASVVAGDEDALTVQKVCERAGVTILKSAGGPMTYHARQTMAISTITALVERRTAMVARMILEVLANADLAPITAHHIRAAEYLMTHKETRARFEPADLTDAIASGFLTAEDEAKVLAYKQRLPYWEALATVWFRKTKKIRGTHVRLTGVPSAVPSPMRMSA